MAAPRQGKVKEKWGNLTDDDLTAINGRRDQFEGKITASSATWAARFRRARSSACSSLRHCCAAAAHWEDLKDYFDLFLRKAKRRAGAGDELKKMMEDEAAN